MSFSLKRITPFENRKQEDEKKIGKENEAKAEVTQIRGLLCFYSDYILNGQHCVPLSWKCHDTGALNLDKDSTKLLTECNTTE